MLICAPITLSERLLTVCSCAVDNLPSYRQIKSYQRLIIKTMNGRTLEL